MQEIKLTKKCKRTTEIPVQILALLTIVLHIRPQKCYFGPFSKLLRFSFRPLLSYIWLFIFGPKKCNFGPFSKPPKIRFRLWLSYLWFFIFGLENATLTHFQNGQDSVSNHGPAIYNSSNLAPKMQFWPVLRTTNRLSYLRFLLFGPKMLFWPF